MTEPLSNHRLFHTSDIEQARHIVSQKFCPHKLIPGSSFKQFETRHNHAAGLSLSLNYLHYGCDVSIDPGELGGFYLIQIPLSGAALVQNGKKEVVATPKTATVLNATLATKMSWDNGCRKLLLQINRDTLHRTAEALTDHHLDHPPIFDPEMKLDTPEIKKWVSKLHASVIAAQNGYAFGNNMHAHQSLLEEELICGLLEAHSSSISHMLKPHKSVPTSAVIKRGRSYIMENLAEAITVSDIAEAAGCSLRGLQMGFRQRFGCSPMKYLRLQRLKHAHYLLQTLPAEIQISSVAFDVGYTHLGRFAIDYRNQFGVSPRETLANRNVG
ncbi:MAG: AraC family transcriptional regulator [Salaquimonas sp.]